MRRPASTMSPPSGSYSPAISRRIVVLPHPEGPSKVVKLPRGTASETSSTAGGLAPKRLVTPRSSTCASGTGDLLQTDPPPGQEGDDHDREHRQRDDRDGEGGRAAPVEVVDELEDRDRGDGRRRREQEDQDREGRDRA